jgi:hypothetical protein
MYRPRQGGHAVASRKPYALAARTEVAQTCPALRPQVKMLKEQRHLSVTVQRYSASDIGPLCDAMQSGMIGLAEPQQCVIVMHLFADASSRYGRTTAPIHQPSTGSLAARVCRAACRIG